MGCNNWGILFITLFYDRDILFKREINMEILGYIFIAGSLILLTLWIWQYYNDQKKHI